MDIIEKVTAVYAAQDKMGQEPRMLLVYGDFTEPVKNVNFIIVRLPHGRVPWSKKIAPAVNRLVMPWMRNRKDPYWNCEGIDQKETSKSLVFRWDGEKLVEETLKYVPVLHK